MKWAIDKIENNIAILEEITTKEKKEVSTLILPSSIHEGSILIFENNTYSLDIEIEQKRRQEILERFKRLRDKS